MNRPVERWLVFDIESVGLHGEGFAFGAVVLDDRGREVLAVRGSCPPSEARGPEDGREWVAANCPALPADLGSPLCVRGAFWALWMGQRDLGAVLAADAPWPVEARFLLACIDDDPEVRAWLGPYPLIDVASVRLAAGLDPLGAEDRLSCELPIHDPLADARQSARLLVEALQKNKERG